MGYCSGVPGLKMEGVLEATITLCGCKVLCSILCLPAFKESISSVSLCCICLLLFTDLSITMFLVYLWCVAPRPMSFHPSSDVIALRFMLFLSNTYEAVLMLTPLLVTIELLVCLLLRQRTTTLDAVCTEAQDAKGNTAVHFRNINLRSWQSGPKLKEDQRENTVTAFKALGFLGCLLLWGMCGTYSWFSWKQEQMMVRSCLERGSLLSTCLPCLVTSSSSVQRVLFWALPAAGFLLALTAVLSLGLAKLRRRIIHPEQLTCIEETFNDFDALGVRKTQEPVSEKNPIPADSLSHHTCNVDSNNSCCTHSLQSPYNRRRWTYGNSEPLAWIEELADSCMSKSDCVMLVLPPQCTAQATLQSPHPHKNWIWQTWRESPSLRVELMTGLLCGLLVCVFPTVLSTNILLVSNLDTLAVYTVKHLLSAAHSK